MKIKFPKNKQLAKLPPKVEITIFLIKAELKSVKFTNDLHKAGTDASAGLLDLSALTSAIVGFKGELTDEFNEWYFERQTALASNIDPDNDNELSEQAFNFYIDLVIKKREWEGKYIPPRPVL